jgi:putative flippase GtrA
MPNLINKQFLVFLLVGGLNTIFGYLIFALFIYCGMHYIIASLLGTIVGVLFNFKTTGQIVFKSYDNSLIYRFFMMYAVIYIINIIILKIMSYTTLNMYINGMVAIPITAIIAFLLNKYVVFREQIYEIN